ncbi:MAG: DUF4974 domain-containing protein [Tannerellaceae bacterium]|nr:DUF4974 domain-containing protein [Tannerellaceae bacterium]
MHNLIPWNLIKSHLKKENNPENEGLFSEWLSDPENKQLYTEIESLWDSVQEEVWDYQPDLERCWTEIESKRNRTPKQKKFTLRNFYKWTAVACLFLLLGSIPTYWLNRTSGELHTFSIVNGKSKLLLPDGSLVWLNAGSNLSYPGNFRNNRELALSGEASFQVKQDKRHPFIVSVADLKVKVHGTTFNINSYETNDFIYVVLEKGLVSVLYAGEESFLQPGDKAFYNKKEKRLEIAKADLELEMFWTNESVYFKSKPLGYICRYLEKWYNEQIEVYPEISESQLYTFTIRDDSLEAILQIMSKINPITYTINRNEIKIMKVKP